MGERTDRSDWQTWQPSTALRRSYRYTPRGQEGDIVELLVSIQWWECPITLALMWFCRQ
jgi:hypothetical protein